MLFKCVLFKITNNCKIMLSVIVVRVSCQVEIYSDVKISIKGIDIV